MMTPRTLFEKVWQSHVVAERGDDTALLYIDCHLVNEVTSPQAFEGLRRAGRSVRAPHLTIAVADHNVPTDQRSGGVAAITDRESQLQIEALERNVREFAVPYIPLQSRGQGIVHIIGPELGLTQPGMTIVCGDSHTSTHGAFGALAFGIGTSEIEHVLATQTLIQRRPKTLLIEVSGTLSFGVAAKDLVLYIISTLGAGGATGHVIEYRGPTITALDMAGRMTLCNMAIEMGARAGMIAADQKTIDWIAGRSCAPAGAKLDEAVAVWRSLHSDSGARFDKVVSIDASKVKPMVTWGTSSDTATTISGAIPLVKGGADGQPSSARMLEYMDLTAGSALSGLRIDVVFIGSCTNGRLEDLREAAAVIRGRSVAPRGSSACRTRVRQR